MEQIIRVCKKCNEIKPINNFPKSTNKNTKNETYRHSCLSCYSAQRKTYFQNYYKKNPDKYYQRKEKINIIKNE